MYRSTARLRRHLAATLASLAVLVTTLVVLTGADVVAPAAHVNPITIGAAFDGVPASARNYADSTVTLCPQATTVSLRLRNRITGRPLSRRRYTIYWSGGGSAWRSTTGVTSRSGTARHHLAGRLTWLQVSGNGYSHYFTVRYRACTTSVARVAVSAPFGVRGDDRAHVRLAGRVYAERSNGQKVPFRHGLVTVRNDHTGARLATLRASVHGDFSGQVPVPGPARLTITPVAGPTGATTAKARPVTFPRSWLLRPSRTAVVRVPTWMRDRRIHYVARASFSPRLARYAGSFADPAVMRVGRTYYAASTTGSDLNLPLLASRNLSSWRPRAALRRYYDFSSSPTFNDAMPQAPAWAVRVGTRENVKRISLWAPSLARVGKHRYVAAFSAATKATQSADRHSCIGLAVSSYPAGPYHPFARPLVCDPSTPFGVIDPDLFVDPGTHHVFLVWAAEGIPGRRRVQLAIRQLNYRGTGWARGSRRHDLLTFSQRWEGVIMENPSMIRYRGTLYLFYSANAYATSRYATGYAVCRSVAGPCFKPRRRPLLATRGTIAGPGGADAFVDVHGQLRLAYAAWRRGRAGMASPGRTLHIATLRRSPRTGRLSVRRMTR